VIAVRERGHLVPLPLARRSERPPQGMGNRRILEDGSARDYAEQAVEYVQSVLRAEGLRLAGVAIDAPSDYCASSLACRKAEVALGDAGMSYFKTPTAAQFAEIVAIARRHLRDGGPENRLPHANKLWMLAGFELFRAFGSIADCREVYPQAIVRALRVADRHKTDRDAWCDQLRAAAKYTGWPVGADVRSAIREVAWGSNHDRVDAYLAAWVASLPDGELEAFGLPPDDAIWNPKVPRSRRPAPRE